jgi:hypothetical protein
MMDASVTRYFWDEADEMSFRGVKDHLDSVGDKMMAYCFRERMTKA